MIKEKTIFDIGKRSVSLLEKGISQAEIEKNLKEIHVHFQKVTAITGFDSKIEHMASVLAAKGKALGLNYAAQCLLDYKRTVKFLRAVVKAIKDKQKASPGELIHIFYAGCGPYAPFITLVAPLFSPDEIRFSILEINGNSLESAKGLIESLELSDYVEEFHLGDAVIFEVTSPEKYHILISETLDALLYRECYLPILFNMLPQFNENITLIPENVCLNLIFLPYSAGNHQECDAGKIIDAREAVTIHGDDPIPLQLPEKTFALEAMERYKSLIIDTKVHIYDDIWLDRGESSLTLPLEMILDQPFQDGAIVFTYHMEPDIELKYVLE